MDNNKKRLIFLISGILLILALIGTTYAFFFSKINGLESASTLVLDSANMSLVYEDGSDTINGTDIFPGWYATKTFSVTNNGDLTANYAVKIANIVNNLTLPGSISVKLKSNDGGYSGGFVNLPTTDSEITPGIEIGVGDTHHYTITVMYNNLENADQSVDVGKTFRFNVTIAGTKNGSVYYGMPDGWNEALATSLLGSIRDNENTKINAALKNGEKDKDNCTLTTPGQQTATCNEGLRVAEDDYGMSFYYRGAVENNYVKFADMCWRIVRIDGNGNIKLTLYNYQKESARETIDVSKKANPCDDAYSVNGDEAFARYDNTENGSAGKSAYNTKYNQNAYIGLIYGTPGSNTYEAEHNGNNLSTILANLNTWFTSNLNIVDSKILNVAYCNDKTLASSTYNPDNWTDSEINKGYGQIKTNYSARERLNTANTATPVLTCPEGVSRVENKIGLLSADEVAYAGGIYGSSNTSYYLNKNASSSRWWTSTPSRFYGFGAMAWRVETNGALFDPGDLNKTYGLRPAIVLKSTVAITGGVGTQANPYVIN